MYPMYQAIRICYLSLISIAVLCFMIIAPAFSAEPVPVLNSISMDQQKKHLEAATRGIDEPIADPKVSIPVSMPSISGPSAIEKQIAQKLAPISLEEKIQKQSIQPKLEQFGYDLFNQVPSTYVPVTNIPVPMDYIIGPGDTIIVQLYGKTNVEYKLVVSREGNVLVPDLGPVIVSGLTFSEVKIKLNQQFQEKIFGTKTSITMGSIRTINIMIVGDVVNPGSYTVSGLTDLLNAVLSSGGIKRTGSLRNIQHKRNNRVIDSFDLYEVLLSGNTRSKHKIAHGDVIFVPPIGPTVAVGGEVQRPAIYELKNNFSFNHAIKLAGGLLPTASLESSHIERIKNNQYHTLISLAKKNINKLKLQAGDLIRIFTVKKVIDEVVLLSGQVFQPGGYQFYQGMKLSDLIHSSKQLLQNADTDIAILRRENQKYKRIEVKYVSLKEILYNKNSEFDFLLQPRDEVIIFNQSQNRSQRLKNLNQELNKQSSDNYPPMIFSIEGHVKYPGAYPLEYSARLLDVLNLAGNPLSGTDTQYILMVRQLYPSGKLDIFSIDLNKSRTQPLSEWNTLIHPEDTIYVFNQELNRTEMIKKHLQMLSQQTEYGQLTKIVSIGGEVKHTGNYPLEPGMRMSRLIKAAGGLLESSYGLSAELTRNRLIDGQYQVVQHETIDLQKLFKGEIKDDPVLKPQDQVRIKRKPQWGGKRSIELAGEVVFPGKYAINKNETLCHVINRAGGLTNKAYPFGAVFTRETVRNKQQQSLDRVQGDLDDLLVKLHLSPSVNNNDKMPSNDEMHEINKVITKLKRAKASGRMVVDMSKILQCHPASDLLLENGDRLLVPAMSYDVSVMGEVFHPATHSYVKNRGSQDYINLSGGVTDLGKNAFAYVVQANGEIHSVRDDNNWFNAFNNIGIKPGATIYVPIHVDRSNTTENVQSWTEILFKLIFTTAGISAIL